MRIGKNMKSFLCKDRLQFVKVLSGLRVVDIPSSMKGFLCSKVDGMHFAKVLSCLRATDDHTSSIIVTMVFPIVDGPRPC
jgi:hypothetical protein